MRITKEKILRNYVTPFGESPFLKWLYNLKDTNFQFRVRRRVDRLKLGNPGDCKPVGQGVSELRLFFGPGYRVYFAEYDDLIIVLLGGGDKTSQKKDIQLAKIYWRELKERSNEQIKDH